MRENKDLALFEPGAFMRRFFRDADRFFEPRGPSLFTFPREFGEFAWSPQLEMTQRDHHLFAKFDLPGMKKEEITVTVENGAITVSGERKKESEDKKNDWSRSERLYGSFSRTIPVPEGVKPGDVTATFTNGVLELSIPLPALPEANAPRKIAIGEGKERKAA